MISFLIVKYIRLKDFDIIKIKEKSNTKKTHQKNGLNLVQKESQNIYQITKNQQMKNQSSLKVFIKTFKIIIILYHQNKYFYLILYHQYKYHVKKIEIKEIKDDKKKDQQTKKTSKKKNKKQSKKKKEKDSTDNEDRDYDEDEELDREQEFALQILINMVRMRFFLNKIYIFQKVNLKANIENQVVLIQIEQRIKWMKMNI